MIHEKFEPCRRSFESLDLPEIDEVTGSNNISATPTNDGSWKMGKKDIKLLVPPPRQKRDRKTEGSEKSRAITPHNSVKKYTTIVVPLENLPDKKPNLPNNKPKLERIRSQKQSIDIFKLNHSDAFDEFDSMFETIPVGVSQEDDKTQEINHQYIKNSCNHTEPKPEPISRLNKIQFRNDFVPNSLYIKRSDNSVNETTTPSSNTIDYYMIRTSLRKYPQKSESEIKYFGDENSQIWTI
ncbi:hypothetical protein DMENIID0001_052250 [Sergentomyia squamirostris]